MDNLKDDRYYIGEAVKDFDKILAYAKRVDFPISKKTGRRWMPSLSVLICSVITSKAYPKASCDPTAILL